ncbi:universal stress protein [Streptomyces sp. NBC_01500]|uniref:universal stress protein n=2 Tax=unclassified Streptomyces TaxID=2593676 RepID=UPI00225C05C5|nr:universal stress protein [Streptomyces sp. NBC_01500]MCX4553483.1 universal stress protein [Streptomyces sp. NBC_01500]
MDPTVGREVRGLLLNVCNDEQGDGNQGVRTMDGPVIVGTDGSAEAMDAVEWAALEADRWARPLRIVHALRHAHVGGLRTAGWLPPGPVGDARRIVAQAEERAREVCPGLTVHVGVFDEAPVEYLVSASNSAGLVVVGGRGHGATAGLLLGSVSGAVAARAKCAVTVVRRHRRDEQGGVVVGLGRSTAFLEVLDYAFGEARRRDRGVAVVHAWICPRTESATAHTGQYDEARDAHRRQAQQWLDGTVAGAVERHEGVPVRSYAVEGPAGDVLAEASREAGLLVIGGHSRHAGTAGQPRNVGHRVLHRADCTVTIVPSKT